MNTEDKLAAAQNSGDKQALRRIVRTRLRALTTEKRGVLSEQARMLLARQALWQEAHSILFFAPKVEEVDVWPLFLEALASGKCVGLPRFSREEGRYVACRVRDPAKEIETGQYGIREPVREYSTMGLKLDLILVPGVAFDLHGRRLGRGKGFYDRLLAAVRGKTCGVAFDEQIVPAVPVEPHDMLLNCILTPTRWVEL
jgi:5-formyltetrahydrofolate cyclo-ligase